MVAHLAPPIKVVRLAVILGAIKSGHELPRHYYVLALFTSDCTFSVSFIGFPFLLLQTARVHIQTSGSLHSLDGFTQSHIHGFKVELDAHDSKLGSKAIHDLSRILKPANQLPAASC